MSVLYCVCPDGWVFAEVGRTQLAALHEVRYTLDLFGYDSKQCRIYTEAAREATR